ncbi:MAG: SCP2 sterol-binding domain-containing protein [Bdellovibrio bacteriovorus]
MTTRIAASLAAVACAFGATSASAVTFMDADWAASACSAWNSTPALANGLGGDAWAANDGGRGYKIIQLYRTKCGEGSKVELEIQNKDGKAHCARGGAVKHATLDPKLDYLMNATDEDWACMGQGKFGCGAMGAMTTGKLKFKGPKMEAMGVMGPFDSFLLLTGKVAGDTSACPK